LRNVAFLLGLLYYAFAYSTTITIRVA